MIQLLKSLRKSDSGTAAVEFALVGMVAIVTFLAVIEFGRTLYVSNAMSYAVDLAARKILTNPSATNGEVEQIVRDAIGFGASTDLQMIFGNETVDTIPFRTLLLSYPVTLLIPNLTKTDFVVTINRRVPLR